MAQRLSRLAVLRPPSGSRTALSSIGPLSFSLARLLDTMALRRRLLSEYQSQGSPQANSSSNT